MVNFFRKTQPDQILVDVLAQLCERWWGTLEWWNHQYQMKGEGEGPPGKGAVRQSDNISTPESYHLLGAY